MPKLIVALGNPGREYEATRHNIGWQAISAMKSYSSLSFHKKFKGEYAQKVIEGETVYFLKPQTYMNLSGESVVPMIQFFKIEIADILVVHDELDLPFGTLMFKDGGGLAGHNGLKSISSCLGSQAFKRLRLGIGRPDHGSVSNWVLSPYSDDEKTQIEKYLEVASDAITAFIIEGPEKAFKKYNKKSFLEIK